MRERSLVAEPSARAQKKRAVVRRYNKNKSSLLCVVFLSTVTVEQCYSHSEDTEMEEIDSNIISFTKHDSDRTAAAPSLKQSNCVYNQCSHGFEKMSLAWSL